MSKNLIFIWQGAESLPRRGDDAAGKGLPACPDISSGCTRLILHENHPCALVEIIPAAGDTTLAR